jgi:hypothetical protein
MTRVLVCGGRKFNLMGFMFNELDKIQEERGGFSILIEGEAPGADQLSANWALSRGVPLQPFPAKWEKHGRSAGPIRNEQMLREGRPDLVIAFPGGYGTAHMVKIAKKANIEVLEYATPTSPTS